MTVETQPEPRFVIPDFPVSGVPVHMLTVIAVLNIRHAGRHRVPGLDEVPVTNPDQRICFHELCEVRLSNQYQCFHVLTHLCFFVADNITGRLTSLY